MRFSWQEYWSELPCPPPGDLPDAGIKPVSLKSPALAGRLFTTSATGEALDQHQDQFSLGQSLSRVRLFATPWAAALPPRPSPTPRVHSNSRPLSRWCHPAISSSVIPFSSPLQSYSASGSFQMSQLFTSGGQSIGSFSFSISPVSPRMDWLDLLAVQETLKSLLQHHSSKASILWCSALFTVQFSHPCTTTGKTIALTRQTFVGKVISLLFNMLSRLAITFLPRSKGLLISWLQSPSVVIWEPKKIKSVTVSTVSPSICHEVMGPDTMIWVFWLALSQFFHSPLSLSSKGSLVLLCFLP